jgi:signal transduction histidine kinase
MAGVFVQRLGAPEGVARRFLVYCMVAGFAALLATGVAAAWLTSRASDHTNWVNHTYQVEVSIGHLQALIEQTETTRRGYLLTGDQTYLDTERETAAMIGPALDVVERLTADNPIQRMRVGQLRTMLAEIQRRQDETIATVLAGQQAQAVKLFEGETSLRRIRGVRALTAAMATDERTLLKGRDQAQQSAIRTFYIVLAVIGVLIVVLAVVSLATVLRYTRDLGNARDRLQLLNSDLEGAVAERTADLTRANQEIQRFAYIVSHDLRSPLVNVMGFTAELDSANTALKELVDNAEKHAPGILTEEAAVAAREDLPEAIGFIRSSTQKMDRLINAILRLSREGRRTLVHDTLSLAEIAEGVRDSLRHIADDKGATIVVERPMPPLIGDRLAIEQVLSNLVENAVKYLSPDRPGRITVRATAQGDRRLIDVIDNGRGIADSDHERIFDLFRRSGAQDQPGEGIGLAHVRALVHRLGGTIHVSSTLGTGSTFRVNLPATLPEAGPTP